MMVGKRILSWKSLGQLIKLFWDKLGDRHTKILIDWRMRHIIFELGGLESDRSNLFVCGNVLFNESMLSLMYVGVTNEKDYVKLLSSTCRIEARDWVIKWVARYMVILNNREALPYKSVNESIKAFGLWKGQPIATKKRFWNTLY